MDKKIYAVGSVLISGCLALTACGGSGSGGGGTAQATDGPPSGTLVVAESGGDFLDFVEKHVMPVFTKEYPDVKVQFATADNPVMSTKLHVEKNAKQGSYGLVMTDNQFFPADVESGALEKIDYSKIPNADHVIGSLKADYDLPISWAPEVLIYNKDHVSPAPDSWNVAFDSKYTGKIGMIGAPDHAEEWIFAASAAVAGNDPGSKDWNVPYDQLKKLASQSHLYATQNQLGEGLLNQESWIAVDTLNRANGFEAAKGGDVLAHVLPKEGSYPYILSAELPKNSPNKAAAYAFMKALVNLDVQKALTTAYQHSPSVDNADIPADIRDLFVLSNDELARVHAVDDAYVVSDQKKWSDFWTRDVMQGG